jgi:maltooligosyltrehalose trehalohydrolase
VKPRVWAPLATSVSVCVGDGGSFGGGPGGAETAVADTPLAQVGDGWWEAAIDVPSDVEYAFVVNGDGHPLPDPRSLRQPHGVHKPSAIFDLAAHVWADAAWTGRQLAGGVIYELHIGTFTPQGTLDSAIERLDHLVSIGVSFVELLPVNAFNGEHNWGYDGVLWFAVHEAYGGPAAYQRFVDACHARNVGVIQDVVYNHFGPSGNYLPQFGPYLHEASANTWGSSVNLGEPEVRRFILDNVAFWLRDMHVDGLRLDAVHALVDDSATHLLQQMAEETDALSAHLGRPLSLIAESDLNDPIMIASRDAGGYGLTAQWSDDYHHALHVALTGETTGYYADFASLGALAKTAVGGYFHDGTFSSFRGRDHGHPIDSSVPTSRLVVFSQDHDQIGNRAVGDRLTASLNVGQLSIAAVLTLASPFTPMLFMGEEWGASTPWQFFTSHPEPELGEATARGRIAEFERMGWDPSVVPDPQDPQTFARSKLEWRELAVGDHARLLELYRGLAVLRRDVPELTDSRFEILSAAFDDDAHWFRLDRGAVSIVTNFGEADAEVPLAVAVAPASCELLLATDAGVVLRDGAVMLPGHSAAIVRTVAG